MTRKPDNGKGRMTKEELEQLWAEDWDLPKIIVEQTVQPGLEAEREQALQAGKSEQAEARFGYRAGYYRCALISTLAIS